MNTSDVARRIVNDGLERRKLEKQEAMHEAQLEQYEQEMISACNQSCANAKLLREKAEADQRSRRESEARRAAKAEALAMEHARDNAAVNAVRHYGLVCLGILWLASVTQFPFWAAATLIFGGAVFPSAYIFRLYYPLEGGKEDAQRNCSQ